MYLKNAPEECAWKMDREMDREMDLKVVPGKCTWKMHLNNVPEKCAWKMCLKNVHIVLYIMSVY